MWISDRPVESLRFGCAVTARCDLSLTFAVAPDAKSCRQRCEDIMPFRELCERDAELGKVELIACLPPRSCLFYV